MNTRQISLAAGTAVLLLQGFQPAALADSVCTARPATAAEKKLYGDAYALFLRVAPKAPDGWKATDSGAEMPTMCQEYGRAQLRRSFGRDYELERGVSERDATAQQGYAATMEQQRARAAANQAAVDAIDAKINALALKAQAAATAQKFDQIEALNQQIDALAQKKMALMGVDDMQAQTDRIEAEASRDTRASFRLRFEAPTNSTPAGAPYRTAAGRARVETNQVKGNPTDFVTIEFGGAPEQAVVSVEGDPARVRALVDAADLKAIAAFK